MQDSHSPQNAASPNGAATARAVEPEEPDPREARVAELRKQYLEGTYQVEASELIAAIIDKHLEE
ncbi:MAG: flagellar biosynthesis anti-sigma factor FlgM [Acidobacteriaceae bacterium]|nr:flagellar biosynthesis anti-sigma factor FlgM [Acidobacteriaceae bacterium]MBV9766046.1 flagellar biosynthesis anti-sigma factor FlgM [Acidobacteriaceae bacterium]